MKPKAIFILAACLMLWAVVIYKCIERAPESHVNPPAWVVHNGKTNKFDSLESAMRNAPVGASVHPGHGVHIINAKPDHDPDAQRVINELVEHYDMTPEESAERYKLAVEWGQTNRHRRPSMPGVRTNIDAKRWPIFEE